MKTAVFFSILILLSAPLTSQTMDTAYVSTDDHELYTVLTTPSGSGQDIPLAVIIPGSGPTDLNGNQQNMVNNSLLYLSDGLVVHGIATLRFDKWGIGQSLNDNFREEDLTVDLYARDVVALIQYAREQGYSDISIIGHSEGSLIGLIAAQDVEISGFVSIAGAGSPADEILKDQLEPQLPAETYSRVASMIDSLKDGQTLHNVPPSFYALFRPSVQPYLISWFRYDPAELIGNLTCPVLIVQGDKDLQVSVSDAENLAAAAPEGNLVIIKEMNHVLKNISGNNQDNLAAYSNPDLPVNAELVRDISEFIMTER